MTERARTLDGVDALLFDLGGVLLHVHFERALAHWAGRAGVPVPALAACFAQDDAYARHERGEIDFAGYAQSLRACLGLDLADADLREGWNLALGAAMRGAGELVDAAAALRPCYLFSNTNPTHHECWSREHAALLAPMRGVFASSDIGARKPEPEAYARVVAAIGAAPERILFFDDLADNVEGARRAGLRAIRVAGPDDVARHLGLGPGALPGRALRARHG